MEGSCAKDLSAAFGMAFKGKTNAVVLKLLEGTSMDRKAGDELFNAVEFVADWAIVGF